MGASLVRKSLQIVDPEYNISSKYIDWLFKYGLCIYSIFTEQNRRKKKDSLSIVPENHRLRRTIQKNNGKRVKIGLLSTKRKLTVAEFRKQLKPKEEIFKENLKKLKLIEKAIWVKTGYNNLQNLSRAIESHEKSQEHISSIKFELFGKQNIANVVDTARKRDIENFNEKVRENREILKRLIDAVVYLSKEECSFRGHDETQLSVIFRYVIGGDIVERFVGFYDVSSGKNAESLYQLLVTEFQEFDLKHKLIAQTYYGAAVMSGDFNGLQSKIKNIVLPALFTHCYAHKLNLVLSKACNGIKQIVERAVTKRPIKKKTKKPKKNQKTVFTEEDFRKFEEEYFDE
nr:unnamed protein product [Callosobruchus analis]